jgi:cyclase
LGDSTLILDSFETPLAALDLLVASVNVTGRKPKWVINSHGHPDHWFGNQVFPENATIIAAPGTREHMFDFITEVEEEKSDPSEFIDFVRNEKERLSKERNPSARAEIMATIARWEYYLESLPNLKLRLPDQTFEGKMTFHGSFRHAEIIDAGAAHTPGDSYLILPTEKIAFIGDLGFFQHQPYLADCHPDNWISKIEEFENSDFNQFIPGHDPIGTKKDLHLQKQYILMLQELVIRAKRKKEPFKTLLKQQLPEPFNAWSVDGRPREANLRFLYDRANAD